jgi:hypothetical protein
MVLEEPSPAMRRSGKTRRRSPVVSALVKEMLCCAVASVQMVPLTQRMRVLR